MGSASAYRHPVYPAAGVELHEKFRIQGHDVTVATVDLAKPWQEVHQQLLDLVG